MPPEAGAAPGAGAGQGGAAGTAGNTGTGNTVTTGNAGAAGAAAPTNDWTQGFSEDLRGYVTTKGFKDSASLADSYRNFEKLQGVPQDRIIKLPEKPDDPAWADINYRLGTPKEAKEYQFEVPKEIGDEEFSNKAKDWFHKNGVPRAKAEAIVKSWNEHIVSKINEDKTNYSNEVKKQEEGLRREWGTAFEQNVELGKRAAAAFGFDEQTIGALEQSMGFAGIMKFMHNLQVKIGEDGFVGSSQNNSSFGNIMTPAQAKSQIAMRKQDLDFTGRLLNKEKAAVEEWNNLHKQAFPDPS